MSPRGARKVGAQVTAVASDAILLITVGEKLLEMAITLLGAEAVQAKLDAQFAAVDAAADAHEALKFPKPDPVTRPETPDALKKGP